MALLTTVVRSCAIAIFVKTPGLTPIKTRLAASIGVSQAEFFYKKSLNLIRERLSQLNGNIFFPHWAVTEREGLTNETWTSFPTILQKKGNLGTRIHSIYSTLIRNYDFVLLIGSDSPHLPIEYYTKAYDNLLESDFVIGPTEDGGFYLFGGNKNIPQKTWLSTPYSTTTTYNVLTKQLKKIGHISVLPQLFDVDTVKELKRLAKTEPQFQNFL